MKHLQFGFCVAFVAGFVLTASCGGSTDNASGTAGAGGGGRAIAGASSSEAGRTSGGGTSGATARSDGGAGNDGGASNVAGAAAGGVTSGGATDGGGATMNPADCPAAAPLAEAPCAVLTNLRAHCNYPGTICRCGPPVQGAWGMVPGAAAGAAAEANSAVWRCSEPTSCPAFMPAMDEPCTSAPGECQYPGDGTCTCGPSGVWSCQAARTCPRSKPETGSACTGSNFCSYGNDNGCVCSSRVWVCN